MPNSQRFPRDDTGRPHAAARGYCSRQWKLIRVLALIRDAWQCRQCRRVLANAREAHVDHIVSKRDGGTDDLDNLQTLCRSCHSKKTCREQHPAKQPALQWCANERASSCAPAWARVPHRDASSS